MKNTNRRIITGLVIAIAAIIFVQCIFYVYVYFEKRANHDKVLKLINEDLAFSWDTMDNELSNINDWISRGHFSNGDLGRLYERASLIYMQKGETMAYYRYLGYALYYLERSSEKDYTINVYLDLANFFLNNYAEDSARKMMDSAEGIRSFDEIEDLQIKSYAFRMKGIMAIFSKDFDEAEEYLIKSQEQVDLSHTGVYEECYTAINDTWLARVYYETDRFDECADKLAKWEGHDFFTTDVYRQIFLRDLIVPYYQVKLLLTSANVLNDDEADEKTKEQTVFDAFEEFMELCEENGYEKAELSTILKLQREFPPVTEKSRDAVISTVQRLYTELFNEQNITYANVIDSTVMDSQTEVEKIELTQKKNIRRSEITAIGTILIIVVLAILLIIILNSMVDGLTGLLNRKAFNRMISHLKKGNSEYGIIMIDIDHFKQINDTYGHQNGDVALGRLGQLIQTENTTDVHCYRYGGEEFVIVLERQAVMYAEDIAERLRAAMERQKWSFDDDLVVTISEGISVGGRDADVVKQADDNLYFSKENGRNRITFSDKKG